MKTRWMKYTALLLLIAVLSSAFISGAAADNSRTFTDDMGRTVVLPETVDKIIPSGNLAISILTSYSPEYLASCGNDLPPNSDKYLPKFAELNLPVTGNILGSAATVNYEEVMRLASLGVDVYVDAGQKKGNVAELLDGFTKTSGLPAVFISQNSLEEIPESYRKIGYVLGEDKRGEELYAYLKDWVDTFTEGMKSVEKVSAAQINMIDGNSMYILGGFNDDRTLGYQSTPISTLADNIVTAKTNKGLGDLYGMEETMNILQKNDPDYIFISGTKDHAHYTAFLENPLFAELSAVKSGNVYEIPADCPYLWTAQPFSGWGICGMIWMANIMYPEIFNYDAKEKIQEFYKVMIGYSLSDEEYDELTGRKHTAKSPVPFAGIAAGLAAALLFTLRRR